MEKKNMSGAGGGVGIVGLLQVAFVILKLCKVISWKWVWVLAPTWITLGLVVLLVAVAVILTAIAGKGDCQ